MGLIFSVTTQLLRTDKEDEKIHRELLQIFRNARPATCLKRRSQQQRELVGASAQGDLQAVHRILKQGNIKDDRGIDMVDVNRFADWGERLALHCAKTPAMAETLLDHGARLHQRDKRGNTSLHAAVCKGADAAQMVEFFLDKGLDLEARNQLHQTPLHIASLLRNQDVVTLLLRRGADIGAVDSSGNSCLHLLAQKATSHFWEMGFQPQFQQVSENLISYGANVNATNQNGDTPLHKAVSAPNWSLVAEMARCLLVRGANVNATDNNGQTPLHKALCLGAVQLLVVKGANANVNATDNNGQTPLHLAVDADVAALLLDCGANANARDKKGKMPLHMAVASWNKEVTKLLLSRGADVNAADCCGRTALLSLPSLSDLDRTEFFTQLLLVHGAAVNASDNQGITLLHRAVLEVATSYYSQPTQLLKLFLDKGAHLEAADIHKKTLLHHAAEGGKLDLVQMLVYRGVNIEVVDEDGLTPLHFAARSGNKELVYFLLLQGGGSSRFKYRKSLI